MSVQRRSGTSVERGGDGGPVSRPVVARDRSEMPLGPVKSWPRCLRLYAAMIDHKPTAEAIFWGPTQVAIHNEEYGRLFGRASGQAGLAVADTGGEIFGRMGHAHAEVLRTGRSFVEDKRLLVSRGGVEEEGYFTFRGSPLFDDNGDVAGVHQSVVDNTPQVHTARRSVTLAILNAARDATSAAGAFANAVRANPADVPFALLYYLPVVADDASANREALFLAASVGVDEARADLAGFRAFAEQVLASDWPLLVQDIDARLASPDRGTCARLARKVVALPLRRDASERSRGAIVFGARPTVRLDESYVAFLEAVAERLTAICSTEDREAERSDRAAAEDARKIAERACRAKDEFLAVLGHELRNPLSPILMATQVMKIQDPNVFRREREIIERQVGNLMSLVDDLRDVSQIARGKVELHRRPLELRAVLDEAAEMARPLIERGRHALEMHVPVHGLVVNGDLGRLRQVFSNLLLNAAKYTPAGGRIDVEAERTRETIAVTVRDDGPGIPDDLAPRLFEPFTQGQETFARSAGGLGLGLAIVKNLVTLHGGTVTAQKPASGRGSEFVVVLPALVSSSKNGRGVVNAAGADIVREASSAGRRILVMDPDENAAAWLARLLQAMGHTTAIASDGASALERAHDFHPDVVLLAVDLSSDAGLELARRFRGDPHLVHIRLVAVTERGRGPDALRSRRGAFDEQVTKPIDVALLSRVLGAPPPNDDSPSAADAPED